MHKLLTTSLLRAFPLLPSDVRVHTDKTDTHAHKNFDNYNCIIACNKSPLIVLVSNGQMNQKKRAEPTKCSALSGRDDRIATQNETHSIFIINICVKTHANIQMVEKHLWVSCKQDEIETHSKEICTTCSPSISCCSSSLPFCMRMA